jgi:serine/threonine protein kinase/Tfp pilus assembly protein PilF
VSTPQPDGLLGQTVGPYQVVARVGGGGMGVVYRATDTKLGRTVALKFLPPQWSHDEDARQRFVREAQAASATNHPNICTIHDIETAPDGQLFIVMAYYDGQTLKQRLTSGPLPVEEALDIATQIADGLAKAHARGVVHRDVKPGNVILTEDGVRIVDFGLATFADALKLTVEHSALGTAAYMSPEQVRGQSADARSDVWAVGVMLYEMLTGHVPFQGSHAEAIAYAVRHETPAAIRGARPEVAEEIEQLVFRALHKEPGVRFANGRDLARALRLVRGHTVLLDVLTVPVSAPPSHVARRQERRPRAWTRTAGVVAATLAIAAGALWWATVSAPRKVVAIAPVVNESGHDLLGAYRMALTNALIDALTDSPIVRVVGHDELSEVIRGFRVQGRDLSSTGLIQAVAGNSGADFLIVPTILKDGDRWKARLDIRDPETATTDTVREVQAGVSVLVKESAYAMVLPLADEIEHYVASASWRSRVTAFVHRLLNRTPHQRLAVGSLDAADAFEQGLGQYEELEISTSASSFERASQADPLSPLPVAWRSRVARLMRRDVEAVQLAREAVSRLSTETSESARHFVEAVAAESNRDPAAAEAHYRALVDLHSDDPDFLGELAAFHDRRGANDEAVRTYLQALDLAGRRVRPHVELCRLYVRLNNPTAARQHGETALTAFRAIGASAGEAQALFCLTETLRRGSESDRAAALENAQAALKVLAPLQYRDNLARAHHYVALAFEAQGRLDDASKAWSQALPIARDTNNLLATTVLMNLGATSEKLGRRSQAIEFLRQSASGFEELGDQNRAAQNQFNIGTILVQYGGGWKEGLKDVQSALPVFVEYRDVNFQVAAKQVIATYNRYAGRRSTAASELSQALALAQKADLDSEVATTQIRRAQLLLEDGDYESARMLLTDAMGQASRRDGIEARIVLARSLLRQGQIQAAAESLQAARDLLGDSVDAGLLPPLHAVSGELAYEMGSAADARQHFRAAAAFLTEELEDPDGALARADLGMLDAEEGRYDTGRESIRRTLETARRMGHISLEARCRLYLARVALLEGKASDALAELEMVPPDDPERAIDRELRAHVHYWMGEVLKARGDHQSAASQREAALKIVETLAMRLPESTRDAFRNRPDLLNMLR